MQSGTWITGIYLVCILESLGRLGIGIEASLGVQHSVDFGNYAWRIHGLCSVIGRAGVQYEYIYILPLIRFIRMSCSDPQ